jgi:HAD superfamily hydrolase (TIGR01490 family)
MLMGRIAAFFDFDQTLLTTSSGRLGMRYMWEHRAVTLSFILKVVAANLLYQRHLITEETMSRLLIRVYRNKTLADFEAGAPDFYRQCLRPNLAPALLTRVRDHQNQGHVLVLISGSVRYMLQPVADDLGFDHLVSTDLEVGPDGRLTGRTAGPVCVDRHKGRMAKELAIKENLDLERSFAYGNHQSDLPLLEMVGRPAVVEPTEPLKKVAERLGWPILAFR